MFKHERSINALVVGQQYLGDMLAGHQIGESRALGRVGGGYKGGRLQVKVADQIDIDDRIVRIIPGNQVFRDGVAGWHGRACPRIYRACSKVRHSRFCPH